LDVCNAVNRHTFVSFALFDSFFLFFAAHAVDLGAHLSAGVKRVHEKTVLELEQVVAEERFEHLALSVVELTLPVHHAHFPASNIRVAQHFLRCERLAQALRPVELAESVELSELEIAAILAAIGSDEVTVAMPCTVVPLTRILRHLVGLDLNTVTMSDSDELGEELLVDLGDIFDH